MSLPTTFDTKSDQPVLRRTNCISFSSESDSPSKNKDDVIFGVNREPLIGSVLKSNDPPTETLDSDDEGPDFVVPKRRNRRPTRVSISSSCSEGISKYVRRSSMPHLNRRRTSFCYQGDENKNAKLFIDKVPTNATRVDLDNIFSKFGKIKDLHIYKRSSESDEETVCNYAFINFESEWAAQAALDEAKSGIYLNDERLKVYRRRHSNVDAVPLTKMNSAAAVSSPIVGHKDGSEWQKLLDDFDWKRSAAMYYFRKKQMEDYFREYVHALASFRGLKNESVSDLTDKLSSLSEKRPEVIEEIMPPSISGLVFNQRQTKSFDVRELLQPAESQFCVVNNTIHYLSVLSPEDARLRLKEILLEGLFVYFFAKVLHGQGPDHRPVFTIKFPYYQKSEPIKSTLTTVTGLDNVELALLAFFEFFKETFVFSQKKSQLRLKMDFRDKTFREKLRLHLRVGITPEQKLSIPELASGSSQMLESSDSWEDMASSPSRSDSDEGLPFAMENDLEYFNLLGRVCGVFNVSTGAIDFTLHGKVEQAFFCDKDVYIDGEKVKRLWNHLKVGSDVYLDVLDQHDDTRPFRYRAVLVWVGDKPVDISGSTKPHPVEEDDVAVEAADLEKLHQNLFKELEKYLEPVESVHSFHLTPIFNSPAEMEELPDSVQSVISSVLREDDLGPQLLSNPIVVEDLLYKLEPGLSIRQRNTIKIKVEQELRQFLPKCLIENLHN